MSSDLDDANDAAMDDFDMTQCDSAHADCPRRPSFIKRKLLNLKKNIKALFSQETWDGLNMLKDNVGRGPTILNMHTFTLDAIFHRWDKEMEKDGFTDPKVQD